MTTHAMLTAREQAVLEGLADGLQYIEISDRLHVSPSTVKSHATSVYTKLDARGATHAVAIGFRTGLLRVAS